MRVLLFLALLSSSHPMIVGDSISVRCAGTFEAQGYQVNAVVGRQFSITLPRPLPATVVIELGVNGPIGRNDVDRMMHALHGHRVFFVLTYVAPWSLYRGALLWYHGVNAQLWSAHTRYGAGIIDWVSVARFWGHRVLSEDGLHPTSFGCTRLGARIRAAIG